MRHRRAKKKLGRTSSHRSALFSNLLSALVEHGRIQTTERKARELRGVAERAISKATALGDILLKEPSDLSAEERARYLHAIRLVRRVLRTREATMRLFREWAPRYLDRPGGYTRTFKVGERRGDAAPVALIEFVPAELPEALKGRSEPSKKGDAATAQAT